MLRDGRIIKDEGGQNALAKEALDALPVSKRLLEPQTRKDELF